MSIRLITLGGLSFMASSRQQDWLRVHWHRAALLLYVTLERGCTRDALLAVFWPESDADSAARRLRQAMYALRQALGDDCMETKGRQILAGSRIGADALDFEEAVQVARHAEAITLYRGPFLAGMHLAETNAFQSWVDARRARYARQFRKACRSIVDDRIAAGDSLGAVAAAQAWVTPDPLDDEAQHRLMELLARTGARTEALKQYEAYVRLLQAEDLAPLDQTRELAAAIERQTEGTPYATMAAVPAPMPVAMPNPEPAASPARVHTPAQPADSPGSGLPDQPRRRSWKLAAMLSSLIGAIALLAVFLRPRSSPPAGLADHIVGVLFFQDHSNRELQWLAHRLTRSITDALRPVSTLHVLSENAVWPYRDGLTPHIDLARKLRLEWIIDGNLRIERDSIVARAELLDGTTGASLDRIDVAGSLGNEVQLIDDVVEGFSRRMETFLRQRIGHALRIQTLRQEARDAAAIRLFENAIARIALKDSLVDVSEIDGALRALREADIALERAQAIDPGWAEPAILRAWVEEDIAFLMFPLRTHRDSVETALQRGLRHAEHASALARNDPEVLEVRGVLRHALTLLVPHDSAADAHQLAAAEADLDRATTARPDLVKGLNRLSAIHEQRGDYSRAAVEAEQAWHADAYFNEVDEILNRLFNVNFHQQNDAAASAWCNRIGERFPDSREYARCRLLLMAWTDEPPDTAAAWRLAEIGARASAESIRPTQTAQLHLLVAGVLARSDRQAALLLVRRTRDRFRPDSIFDKPPGVPQLLLEEAAVYALLARAAPGQTEWTSSACDRLDQAARFSGGPVLSRQRQFRDLLESCHIPATMTPRQ